MISLYELACFVFPCMTVYQELSLRSVLMMLLDEWRRLMEADCYVNAQEPRRMPLVMS